MQEKIKQKKAGDNDQSLHEINQYRDAAFPVEMYTVTRESIIPKGRGFLDLHWHEELQLTLVTSGMMKMQVNGKDYVLHTNEAIFINRNCLHITTELTEDGRYVSYNFPEKLLSFFTGSRMEQDYVRPYIGEYALPATVFHPGTEWERKLIAHLWELQDLLGQEVSLDAYRISLLLVQVWYLMIRNMRDQLQLSSGISLRKQERTREMLSFIHEHYREPIQLKDIADAANISEGECCRCFRQIVRESPGQYLQNYRLSRAMGELSGTTLPITEIAIETGFSDVSHFIQYFKRKTGMTPKEYRNQ